MCENFDQESIKNFKAVENMTHCDVMGVKSVEDAQLFILNNMHQQLEKPKAHARLLCADCFSADNNTPPYHFIEILFLMPACFKAFRFFDWRF